MPDESGGHCRFATGPAEPAGLSAVGAVSARRCCARAPRRSWPAAPGWRADSGPSRSGAFDGIGDCGHDSGCHPSWRPSGRAQPLPRDAPGQEPVIPLRLPTTSRPMSGQNHRPPCRVERRERLRIVRAKKEPAPNHDDPHHHRIGGRSLRGDAPHAPSLFERHPSLLQHEWLHLVPRRRRGHERRHLPRLRLHPTHPLIAVAALRRRSRDRFARRDRPARFSRLTHPRRR